MECDHSWMVTGWWQGPPVEGCDQPLELACRTCDKRVGIRCGSSRRSRCEPCATVYRGRVARVAGSGVVVGLRGVFLTLTAPGAVAHARPDGELCRCTPVGGTDLAAWNASAGTRWNNFVRDLSRYLGADYFVVDDEGRRRRRLGVSYFKATELQRRGAIHFHVLLRRVDGRPVKIARKKVRRLAIRHGFGHSVHVRRLEPGHASYAAKYVAKSSDERGDAPWVCWRAPGLRSPWRVDQATGNIVHKRTGEVGGRARLCTRPTFRTWSCSRSWGTTMGEVREAQQHHVLTVAQLPAWSDVPADRAWGRLFGPPRPVGASPPTSPMG